MKRLAQSFEQFGAGRATYEMSDGQTIELDLDEARNATEAEIRAAHDLDGPIEPVPIMRNGRLLGMVPGDFHPMGFDSLDPLYDPRPYDFREENGVWVAHNSLGAGDLAAIPGFIPAEDESSQNGQ